MRSSSRVGEVLRVDGPVIVTYTHPRERVLFNEARDCNPFFHLFEALWMLAGRNDVAPLVYYNPRIAEYSDDGSTLHGAYGYRWRRWFGYDQLGWIIAELKERPESRRCVLQIWNSMEGDRAAGDIPHDPWMARNGGKDVPCNTQAYFALRDGLLDMTVCNRSNDLIWGMLGANVVHFSMLQEYMAFAIGVVIGSYHQISNNLHAYTDRWDPRRWLNSQVMKLDLENAMPLIYNQERFDIECYRFIDSIDGDYAEPFLLRVAQPMMAAFRAHKQRRYYGDNSASALIDRVWDDAWRIAGQSWIAKRQKAWEAKTSAPASVD